MRYRPGLIIVLTILISGCAADDVNLEPTIGSLGEKSEVQMTVVSQRNIDLNQAQWLCATSKSFSAYTTI